MRTKNEDVEQTEDAKGTESNLFGFRAVYVFDRLSGDLWPRPCAPDVWRAAGSRVPSIELRLVCRSATRSFGNPLCNRRFAGVARPSIRGSIAFGHRRSAWRTVPVAL
jgi:hypothetical protein